MSIGPFKNQLDLQQILQFVYDPDLRRLRTDITGATIDATIGDVTITPGDAFRARTFTVDNTVQSISYSGFPIKGIIIKALSENPGYIKILQSNSPSADFYLLSPGESLNIPLQATVSPIYFSLNPGSPAGTYIITTLAVNG